MKIISIVGARPQFVKAAVVSRALANNHEEKIAHTGQHYDHGMSDIFFEELGIPKPHFSLGIGSGRHGKQTGAMLAAIEEVLIDEKPDCVLVYGDTNSTIAGAIAASKLHIPIAHVEAGLRSFNRRMPEEVNRVVTDTLSKWLFTTSAVASGHLADEGITNGVHNVGDVMFDATLLFGERAKHHSTITTDLGLEEESYYLATCHRAENTDDPNKLRAIFSAFSKLDRPLVLPIHPRTAKCLEEHGIEPSSNVRLIDPVGYLDMLRLVGDSKLVLTDSGGLQKEAYYLGRPCVTMRPETEWVETVDIGWNCLADADEDRILDGVNTLKDITKERPELYGKGDAGERISSILSAAE